MILKRGPNDFYLLVGCFTLLTLLESTTVNCAADMEINIDQYIPCKEFEGKTNMNFENIVLNRAPNNNINISFILNILKPMPEPVYLDATLGCKGSKSSPGPFIHVLSANGKDICPSLEKPNSTLANIMDIMGLGGETCPISDGTYDKRNRVLELPEKVRSILASQEYWKANLMFKAGKEKESETYMCLDLYFLTKKISQKKKGYDKKFGK